MLCKKQDSSMLLDKDSRELESNNINICSYSQMFKKREQ